MGSFSKRLYGIKLKNALKIRLICKSEDQLVSLRKEVVEAGERTEKLNNRHKLTG